MIKKTLLTTIIVALCFNSSYVALATNLSPETQAIEESKVKFEQLNDEIISLNAEISKLNIEIEVLNSKLQANNAEIEETDLQINLINSQIEETEALIEKNQKLLDGRVRSMYKTNPTTDMLMYILTSNNLIDAFDRIYSMSKIISLDKKVIDEINEQNEFLIESAEDLSKKQSNLKALQESVKKDLATLNGKQVEQEGKLDKLNSEKANVASVIEANEEKLIAHPLSIINSASSTEEEIKSAVATLKSMLSHISSNYVIDLANSAINNGNSKLQLMGIAGNIGNNNSISSSENYLASYTMESTAYTGDTSTATGLKPVRDPNGLSTVAVDPSVIPLGSKLFIPGYGYAIAADTGGAIKGHIVDVYLNSYEECISWGRRNVTVHLIALPGTW